MKIIIGIDESPYSAAALKWVREMRWPSGTRLLVCSSVPFPAYALVEAGGSTATTIRCSGGAVAARHVSSSARDHSASGRSSISSPSSSCRASSTGSRSIT